MATIKKFEELMVWQKARELNKLIYPLTFTEPIVSDFRYKDQLRGSLGSIMDNIAEGFERASRLEFINALSISKGELGELKSQLYRGFDNNYFSKESFNLFYSLAEEITKMITSLIRHLNRSGFRGQKFRDRK